MSHRVQCTDRVSHFMPHSTSRQRHGCGNTPGEVDLWCVYMMRLAKVASKFIHPVGMVDGSLSSLTYVDDKVSKRLHLLQGQLTRNVQHVAGLNPKAFRYGRSLVCARCYMD